MKTLLFIVVSALALLGSMPAVAQDCPCKVRHEVKAVGATQAVRFTPPFALVPACTAAFVNRGETLSIESASKSVVVVRFQASGPETFTVGDVVDLTCVLTNRRN